MRGNGGLWLSATVMESGERRLCESVSVMRISFAYKPCGFLLPSCSATTALPFKLFLKHKYYWTSESMLLRIKPCLEIGREAILALNLALRPEPSAPLAAPALNFPNSDDIFVACHVAEL